MNKINRGISIFLVVFFGLTGSAVACTVKEVVQMARQGAGERAILDRCDRKISGAPRCSAREVVELAFDEKSESEIRDQCRRCERPTCVTPQGDCRITMSMERITDGGECHCPSPFGWVPGLTDCN